jgi:hypothetical protein
MIEYLENILINRLYEDALEIQFPKFAAKAVSEEMQDKFENNTNL